MHYDEQYEELEREQMGYNEELKRKGFQINNKAKELLKKSAEEIENLYGRDTELSEEIRKFLSNLN